MKIELIEINSSKRELSVIVPWKDLKEDYNHEFKHWLVNDTPKGGRKGKHSLFQLKIFKKQRQVSIDLSFRENAMNKFYQQALENKKLKPINKAEITKLEFEEGNVLKFIAIFEVIPAFKLPNYTKKYKIDTTKYIASDKDVKMSLNELQNNYSTPEEIKGKAEIGFDLIVDYQELNESGNPIPGKNIENQKLKLGVGYGYNLKDFLGCQIGDEIKTTIDVKGKKINFKFLIKKILKNILPELNDAFAKKIDLKVKNIDDLKHKIRDNIQKSLDQQHKKEINNAIMDYFISKTKFDPPISMIDNYMEHIIQDLKQKNANIDEEKTREEYQDIAKKNVKWHLIKSELVKMNNIIIPNKDLDDKIDEFISHDNNQKKQIKEFYGKDENINNLNEQLLNNKLFDTISKYAINKISEKTTSELRKEK